MFESAPSGTDKLRKQIFEIRNEAEFNRTALAIFRFQYEHNPVYRQFAILKGCDPDGITSYTEIPFLPIGFYKTKRVTAFRDKPQRVFFSSGTTGQDRSKHFVFDETIYRQSILDCFNRFYGDIRNTIVLGLIPDERSFPESSLAYMTALLIRETGHPESGLYLGQEKLLRTRINELRQQHNKILLIGLSFALLDMAENFPVDAPGLIVVETGGMKGRRVEMIREKLHRKLCEGFGVDKIHSEYSMSELMSQAWSDGNGVFDCPPWMKVLVRDPADPFTLLPPGSRGGINIIDLAGMYSCSFLEVQDTGIVRDDGTFEISGRFDHSDQRGCSLLLV